ncbi:MAG TPA: hypothetical protein VIB79_18700 [Candidatus Binatia bacterium]|jgi:predicted alpha/beta-fold hydrolase
MGFTSILLTTVSLLLISAEADSYNYPYHDPYLATVTASILNDDGPDARLKSESVRVPALAGRNQLPTLEGRGDMGVALYRQNRPAPLLFILSGIGTNPYFGVATYLARLFYRQGFHILILPSPMTWNFALSASRTGAPGYAPADARDLYEVMVKALSVIKSRHNVKITRLDFMGLSLGALEGAYLSVIDDEERKIGIEKYLLVNPPLDLEYALDKIDEWDALRGKFGVEKSKGTVSKAIAILEPFSKENRDDPAVFDKLVRSFSSFNREQIQFLIAEDLQTLLPELVYVSQAVHDQKLLTEPQNSLRKRLREANDLSFAEYNEKIALPRWRVQTGERDATLDTFLKKGSLEPILDRLRENPKVQIVHNADDCLTDRRSIEKLQEALGEQLVVYPYGGHLGNLWYSENKEYFFRVFRTGEAAEIVGSRPR